jgi:hypothetical protein
MQLQFSCCGPTLLRVLAAAPEICKSSANVGIAVSCDESTPPSYDAPVSASVLSRCRARPLTCCRRGRSAADAAGRRLPAASGGRTTTRASRGDDASGRRTREEARRHATSEQEEGLEASDQQESAIHRSDQQIEFIDLSINTVTVLRPTCEQDCIVP